MFKNIINTFDNLFIIIPPLPIKYPQIASGIKTFIITSAFTGI